MRKVLSYIILILLVVWIFKAWFLPGIITGGDLRVYLESMLKSLSFYPFAWDWSQNNGLGGNGIPLLWINETFTFPVMLLGSLTHFNWSIIERIGFLYPFLLLSIISSTFFYKFLFKDQKFWIFAPLIYLLNTYILLMIGGGQLLIALAYAFLPVIFYLFILLVNKAHYNSALAILSGLLLSIEIMLDLRVAYIFIVAIGIYFVFFEILHFTSIRSLIVKFTSVFLIPGVISGLLQAFWLVPSFFARNNLVSDFGSVYTSEASVKFFSFAHFENALALLHPNWPENIFGKVSFMQPEFLLLPLLAFSSLLFLPKNKREKLFILYFSTLALIGAFLAKGANDPFGIIYLWLFHFIPGFSLFRDPTKWYILVAISYTMLIPYTIGELSSWLKANKTIHQYKVFTMQNIFLLLATCVLLFLIRPAVLGQLSGTFQQHKMPTEYRDLNSLLDADQQFYRTLWIPSVERYGLSTPTHPGVSAEDLFHVSSIDDAIKKLKDSHTETLLQQSSIKYVIIPDDIEKELFLKDRSYDEAKYSDTVKNLSKITWLKRVNTFGKISVFELQGYKKHFWGPQQGMQVSSTFINPTNYIVQVKNAKRGDVLVFAESYDPYWQAQVGRKSIDSQVFANRFNSFKLPQDGTYSVVVNYTLQQWVDRGVMISLITLILVLGYLAYVYLLPFIKKNST